MVLYLILCLISVLAGCGILSLAGVRVDREPILFLAPVVTLCSLTVLMGGLVAGGFTVGEITPAVYAFSLGAAVFGGLRHGKTMLAGWRSLLLLAGLPLLLLLPTIIEGIENYSGGLCMDGWAYVTVGQSLQQYPLGSEGWLPLGTQFSASLGKTRFISMSFLALLAPLSGEHNDTQEVLGHYFGWLFFVYGSACCFFARATRLVRPLAWIVVLLAVLSGWTLKILNANSLDNALALCFLPAVFGILIVVPGPSIRCGIVLGGIWAAGIYAYAESALFTLGAILAMTAQRMIATAGERREYRRMGVAFLTTVAVSVAPYASEIGVFFQRQVITAAAAVGSRPGEGFYTLESKGRYVLPSYWGLTPDFFGQNYAGNFDRYASAMAYMLTLAWLAGMFLLWRRKDWSLALFAAGMTGAYALVLIHFRYPYAAYKILVFTWFAIAYVVVVAAECAWQALDRAGGWMPYAGMGVEIGMVVAMVGFFFLQERIFYDSLPFKSVREFKKVSVLENLAHGQPVALMVSDSWANIWATHFLRKTKLYLADEYHGYMAGKESLLDRSEPTDPANLRFVVTQDSGSFSAARLLSRAGSYYIWDCGHAPWALVVKEKDHAGSAADAAAVGWPGTSYTEVEILSRTATQAIVGVKFEIGAGSARDTRERVRVASDGGLGEERVIGRGMHSFVVSLQPGLNRIALGLVEKAPSLIRSGPVSVAILAAADRVQIRDIENPNGIEKWDSDPFFWLGDSDTSVTISAATAGVAELKTTLMPGPSLADKSKARFVIISRSGVKIVEDLSWGSARIKIPVGVGWNRITMRGIGPTVKVPSDPRTMMVGFRNFQAASLEEPSKGK